jgi:hypothetical protein
MKMRKYEGDISLVVATVAPPEKIPLEGGSQVGAAPDNGTTSSLTSPRRKGSTSVKCERDETRLTIALLHIDPDDAPVQAA